MARERHRCGDESYGGRCAYDFIYNRQRYAARRRSADCQNFHKYCTCKEKSSWIDFDAGRALDGCELTDELFDFVIETANGRKTKNEENGYKEISIFKDGVTL